MGFELTVGFPTAVFKVGASPVFAGRCGKNQGALTAPVGSPVECPASAHVAPQSLEMPTPPVKVAGSYPTYRHDGRSCVFDVAAHILPATVGSHAIS